ncbi:alpha-2-macroglobulin family protein [Reyranella sp.]|uniref:alpha-2-macroglobulin family protein n=1 Tax=Reyranella sp. TaxID=1929291 RepID=UPI003D14CE45
MNKTMLSALIVALMLGSGIAGYLIGKPTDSLDTAAPPTRTATAPAPQTPAPAPQAPVAQRPAPTPATLPTTTPAPTAPAEAFAYRRLSIDNSAAEADSCLFFNKPLATGDTVKYADYVRIAPEVRSALRVVDDKLCIGGLTYGQDYSVTLLSGFPSADGSKLADERKVELALGPRPAVITLPGKGFILPRGTAAGLPITTVNVSKLALSVYRVNERGLDKFIDRYDATFPGSEPMTEFYTLRQWLNGDNGKRIWRGTMEVRNVLNQPVTTAFPIRETVQDWKPGAYFVVAWNAADGSIRENDGDYGEDDESRKSVAGMWVMDTDIALTTLTGRDGLTVFARSIASAQPLPEHEVVLLSRGNEPIGKAVTGADGRATFPAGLLRGRGAAEATSVMVTDANKQEFSRLELTKAAFDLSDRGIDGRALPGPVDAFLYTERGVYRPGETVQLMVLLRDDSAVALKDIPVTLIVKRPDGSEFTRYTTALAGAGALHQAIDLPKSSRRGLWSVAAYIDPKAAPVGRAEFSVEDFVPEKLKVELSTKDSILRTGRTTTFDLSADFLYGAPASGLTVESDLRVVVDPNPFPAFARYNFGSEEARKNFEPPLITLGGPETDENGKSRIEWAGDQVKDTDLALRAQITARVFEPGNGRATKTDKTLPLRTRDVYLGVSPTFEGRYAREGTDTAFDLVAVNADGKQVADSVDYSITRITYDYQWYQSDGRWRWQSTTREREVDAGTLALKADAPVNLSKRLQWGPHRLTVTDKRANTSTTVTFYVGWYGGSRGAEDAPDTLKVASDREKYAPGDTAKLRIEAPFAGEAIVTIATDKVLATYSTQVAAGGTTIDVPIKGDWGAGAYALVTAWRPLASPAERTPVRAIGAVWLALDPALRTLAVQIAAPEKVTPRQRIEVPLRVANAQGSEAFVTLAAVDEGILQLTRFKTPQPAEYYFGKRRLGLDVRDDYGRLLDARADELGKIRTGGDAGDIGGLDVVPTRTVALFSGPVKLDDKGEAKVTLEIPDFIGQLRLMAVAYDKDKVGSGEARLFVRDAVTADVILPRFLAPSDTGRVALSLHNVDGQAGEYKVTLEATGSVALERPVSETKQLAANQRELMTWPLKAGDVGFGKVAVAVSGPGNYAVRREWDIQVRAAQTPSAVDAVSQLEPSRELTVDREVVAPFAAGTAQVSVALSRIPGIDVPALLRALDKYPYGCIEQTTSRALPLLYYNDVALLGYGPADPTIGDRVQDAIYRIVDMQMGDGSFGMWGPFSSPAAEWLQSYAMDFLLRARDQKMAVPAASLQRGLSWLARSADKMSPNAQAYAWYVLAKAGLADAGRVRYFQDTSGGKIIGGLAWTQLAAALNQVGEPGRARLAFGIARQRLDQRDPSDYYGSGLRDRAALLALAQEAAGRDGLLAVATAVRERMVAKVEYTTTQEQAWLVLAAKAMSSGGGELSYSVDGAVQKAASEPVVINPDAAAIARGVRVKNEGERPVWLQVTARGVPKDPQPAAEAGLAVERSYYTLDGRKADLARVRQNDRLVVSIDGFNAGGGYHQVALLDLLPAGFEIESVVNSETVKNFPFLSAITNTRIAEARDDRFFAALDLGRQPYRSWWESDEERKNDHAFHVAYVVRAVTPGSFALPAVHASDMYAPRIFGRTAMGHVTIAPR